jgi:phosphoglycolate phosphatase-like HAD superfamily hydrolase
MKYRLAIFDFDGTLGSSLDGISACMTDLFTAFGYPAPTLDEVKATVGLTLEDSVRILTKRRMTEAQLHAVVKFYRELHDAKAGPSIKLFDGAAKLLELLPSHGIKSVPISNKGRKALAHLLERLRIWAFFDLTLSAEDVAHNKPKPELYSRYIAPHFPKTPGPIPWLLEMRRSTFSSPKPQGSRVAGSDMATATPRSAMLFIPTTRSEISKN